MELTCLAVSGYAGTLLDRPGRLTVCAQFDRVVNLFRGEAVLSLHGPDVSRTPLSLILDRASFLLVRQASRPGLEFITGGGRLCWDGPDMAPGADLRFSCQMTVACRCRTAAVYPSLRRAAALLARPGSLAFAADDRLSAWAGGEPTPVQRRAACRLSGGRPELLLGLGEGLTPAGDDFLVGMLAALAWLGADRQFDDLVGAAAPCLEQTGLLSRAFLRRAMEREFSRPVLDLFEAMQAGGEQELIRCTARLCAVGHTSGSDLLGGVLWALRQDLNREGIA